MFAKSATRHQHFYSVLLEMATTYSWCVLSVQLEKIPQTPHCLCFTGLLENPNEVYVGILRLLL